MKEILITMKTIQRDKDGNDSEMEFISTGTYHEKNGTKYIRYKAVEILGEEEIQTTIKVRPESVILLRHGQSVVRQEYVLGEMRTFDYPTPYGSFEITVKTHELSSSIEDGEGEIHLGYDISLSGEWHYYNQLFIKIREDA